MGWRDVERPGYFGRRRDEKITAFNTKYGVRNWRLVWRMLPGARPATFFAACRYFYEESYHAFLEARPDEVDFICSFNNCIDNAATNIAAGLDYTHQEAFSTHIQDIAVRNVLRRLDRWFEGPPGKILVIRSRDSAGFRFNPGNVPFMNPGFIQQPSLAPSWANNGSVEDFWQSNKLLQVRE